jgi:hypothetical protein
MAEIRAERGPAEHHDGVFNDTGDITGRHRLCLNEDAPT